MCSCTSLIINISFIQSGYDGMHKHFIKIKISESKWVSITLSFGLALETVSFHTALKNKMIKYSKTDIRYLH